MLLIFLGVSIVAYEDVLSGVKGKFFFIRSLWQPKRVACLVEFSVF